MGRSVPLTQRFVRENENEEAVGLHNAARAVDWVPGWETVRLNPFRSIASCCAKKLIHTFGMDQSAVQPGPGGLFPGIVETL